MRAWLLRYLGITLLLGGVGHCAGIIHFYLTAGFPEANRVLLDIWIGESQLLGGSLYLAAARGLPAGQLSPAMAVFGALTIIGFTLPMIPVLFARAPTVFRIPAVIYFGLSVFVLASATREWTIDR